jgi:iron complex outermembrane receptor protein
MKIIQTGSHPLRTAVAIGLAALLADTAAAADGKPQPRRLEEVVVTAQKQIESAQEVPLALTAIQGDSLESHGITNFNDLTKASPSLTVTQSDNPNNNTLALRGIGTYSFSQGVESSVAVILDDVALARQAQVFNSDLIDVERIEVLRGPQSTLYGKSSSAGVVNIVTKAPSATPEAVLQTSVTDDREWRVSGSVSGPLADAVRGRLTAYANERKGNIENLHTGHDLNGSESRGVRAKLAADISPDLDILFIADYSNTWANCCAYTYREVPAGARFFGAVPQSMVLPGIKPGKSNDKLSIDNEPTSSTTDWGSSLQINYAFGDYTLSSITAYRDWYLNRSADVDGILSPPGLALNSNGTYEFNTFSQELRLVSPSSERFSYVAGAYYSNGDTDRTFSRGPLGAVSWHPTSTTEQMALFTQTKFSVTDNLDLIAGLRLNEERISYKFRDLMAHQNFSGSDSDFAIPGKIGLQYRINPDVMTFATYSLGYKGKAYDLSSGFNAARQATQPLDPETSRSFELGIKSMLFDRRLMLNATAFLTKYRNFQAQTIDYLTVGSVTTANVVLANVGKLETKGIEIESALLVTDNLQLNLSLAYTDAIIEQFKNASCWAGQTAATGCNPNPANPGVAGTQDLDNARLNNSPKIKYTLGADYKLPIAAMPFDGFAALAYTWQDKIAFDLTDDPGTVQDAFGILNLSLGIVEKDSGKYKVSLFVNNVLNKSYAAGIGNIGSVWGAKPVYFQQVPRDNERYAGVSVKLAF